MDVTTDPISPTPFSDAEHLWVAAAQILRAQVSEAVWHTTFQEVRARHVDARALTVAVPNTVVRERIAGRYLPLVQDALAELGRPDIDIDVVVQPDALIDVAMAPMART